MATLVKSMPHVAVLLASPYTTHIQFLRGILRFTQIKTPWTLDVRMGRTYEPTSFSAADWNYSGLITNRMPPDVAALAKRHQTPTIMMTGTWPERCLVARVSCDNADVSNMAAEFLTKKGFRNFAYVGDINGVEWSEARQIDFREALRTRGFGCAVYHHDTSSATGDMAHLQKWLAALPKPTAVFAANDSRARNVMDACARAGIAIPAEIAVLGVDNDTVLCDTAHPPLSSIAMTTEQAGFRAAELLNTVIMKGCRGRTNISIKYKGMNVVERRTTAHDFTRDDLVRRCRELIEANIGKRFRISDLAKNLRVSRRTLEVRFRASSGHSISKEVSALRILHAKSLLSQTGMTQAQIATACGFFDASHMNTVFHRLCGGKPSSFRAKTSVAS